MFGLSEIVQAVSKPLLEAPEPSAKSCKKSSKYTIYRCEPTLKGCKEMQKYLLVTAKKLFGDSRIVVYRYRHICSIVFPDKQKTVDSTYDFCVYMLERAIPDLQLGAIGARLHAGDL